LKFILLVVFALNLYAISLDEAIDVALKNSTELKKSSLGVDLAKKSLDEKKLSNYGKVDLIASFTHYNLPRTLTPLTPSRMQSGDIIPSTEDMYSIGVSYSVNLFNGFADTSAIEVSSLQKEISKNMHLLSKEQIIYNVKSLYINILSFEAQLKAQKLYIKTLEKLYEDVKLKVSLGTLAKIDKLKALADLKRAKSKLTDIKTNIKILKETLASVMMVESILNLEKIEIEIDDSLVLHVENLKEEILKTSKLQVASLNVAKKEKEEEKAQSVYYPKISFSAFYGQNAGENDPTNLNAGEFENEDVWQLGLNLQWNVFDFGRKNKFVQKSRILTMQSKLDEEKTKRDLQKVLVEALSKIDQSIQNYKSAKIELELMSETEKIESIRYENGASDINDLLYTKARFAMAKSSYIQAKYSYQNAIYYLDYVMERGEKK
jgi:outer membrane protein TolC